MKNIKLTRQLQKIRYRNRAGVLGGFAGKPPHNAAGIFLKRCSGTLWTWLHAFPGETRTSPKVTSSMTPNLRKIRNCKVLEVLLPGFGNATSGYTQLKGDKAHDESEDDV